MADGKGREQRMGSLYSESILPLETWQKDNNDYLMEEEKVQKKP